MEAQRNIAKVLRNSEMLSHNIDKATRPRASAFDQGHAGYEG